MAALDAQRQTMEQQCADMLRRVNECDSFMKKSELREQLSVLRKDLNRVRKDMRARGAALQRPGKLQLKGSATGSAAGNMEATVLASSTAVSTSHIGTNVHADAPDLGDATVVRDPACPTIVVVGSNDQTIVASSQTHRAARAPSDEAGGKDSDKVAAEDSNSPPSSHDVHNDSSILFFNDAAAVKDGCSAGETGDNSHPAGSNVDPDEGDSSSVSRTPYEEELFQTKRLTASVCAKNCTPSSEEKPLEDIPSPSSYFLSDQFTDAHRTLEAVLENRAAKLHQLQQFWRNGDTEAILACVLRPALLWPRGCA